MENKKSLGILTISKKAITTLIAHIALSCNGVAGLVDRSRRDEVSRVLGKNANKGVYLDKKGNKCIVSVFVTARYGVTAREIGEEISDKVKKALSGTGIDIQVRVNITDIEVENEHR